MAKKKVVAAPLKKERPTATDERNRLRKLMGWPVKEQKESR